MYHPAQPPVGEGSSSKMILGVMPQLAEADDPLDDWTGVTSAAVRRKLQNRLNQRARRRRKGQANHTSGLNPLIPGTHIVVAERVGTAMQQYVQQGHDETSTGTQNLVEPAVLFVGRGGLLLVCPLRRARVIDLAQKAYENYSLHAHRPSHLPTLIRINILNAVARNATTLGFPIDGMCHDDIISPFNQHGPRPHGLPIPSLSCPANFHPTPLQIAMTHHPWIDLFPVPRMRDNILSAIAAGIIDEDELCADIVNTDEGHTERPCMIVWGESWEPSGWEATVHFFRKWGWLTQGCPEVLAATNAWRRRRGEKALLFGDQ